MVNFGYPYNDLVICKDSTDYLDAHRYFYVRWLRPGPVLSSQGKSLPPAGIELGTFGLQQSRVSHVIHCASKTFTIEFQIQFVDKL